MQFFLDPVFEVEFLTRGFGEVLVRGVGVVGDCCGGGGGGGRAGVVVVVVFGGGAGCCCCCFFGDSWMDGWMVSEGGWVRGEGGKGSEAWIWGYDCKGVFLEEDVDGWYGSFRGERISKRKCTDVLLLVQQMAWSR